MSRHNSFEKDQNAIDETNNEHERKLFRVESDDYGDKYQEHYLELYKLYVNTSESIGERRQKNNSFFLTLNTSIIAFMSYVQFGAKPGENSDLYWLISLSGILISFTWYRLIASYKDINTGKFKIIHLIEKKLPLSLYDAEWDVLGRGNKPELYKEFTLTEKFIPWIFFGIHAIVLINVFPWKAICQFL